jgi:plastocyanin
MRSRIKMRNIFLTLFFLCAGISFSQTTHDVTVTNFSFSPQTLTINTGDAIRWTNVLGNHNVVADDNSFTSGPLAPAPWEYIHTFSAAGNNPYYCELHGGPGGSGMSGVIIVQNPAGVDDGELIADKFELMQNYPNPFNPSTSIQYAISKRQLVSLKVYDILGNEVTTLVNEEKERGVYSVNFDAAGLASGMYLYKLQAGSFVETKKMILLQ